MECWPSERITGQQPHEQRHPFQTCCQLPAGKKHCYEIMSSKGACQLWCFNAGLISGRRIGKLCVSTTGVARGGLPPSEGSVLTALVTSLALVLVHLVMVVMVLAGGSGRAWKVPFHQEPHVLGAVHCALTRQH